MVTRSVLDWLKVDRRLHSDLPNRFCVLKIIFQSFPKVELCRQREVNVNVYASKIFP